MRGESDLGYRFEIPDLMLSLESQGGMVVEKRRRMPLARATLPSQKARSHSIVEKNDRIPPVSAAGFIQKRHLLKSIYHTIRMLALCSHRLYQVIAQILFAVTSFRYLSMTKLDTTLTVEVLVHRDLKGHR